jgi:CO/xanthine dehydrogenase FAD-binding subunit
MRLPRFEYVAPTTVDAALDLLAKGGEGCCLFAGGTDLMVKMGHGLAAPSMLVALKEIEGLSGIRFDPSKGLSVGATALLAEVAEYPDVVRYYPAMAQAAKKTANTQIRNMATLAGNLCNAAPSADNAPVLMARGAEVALASLKGTRRLPLDGFFKGPGLTALEPGEILTHILVPPPAKASGASYQWISPRGKVDISAVCVGVKVRVEDDLLKDVRIVLGAVAPTPMRAKKAEVLLEGAECSEALMAEAALKASEESMPITDVRASAEYRRNMVAVLTWRALEEAHVRAVQN